MFGSLLTNLSFMNLFSKIQKEIRSTVVPKGCVGQRGWKLAASYLRVRMREGANTKACPGPPSRFVAHFSLHWFVAGGDITTSVTQLSLPDLSLTRLTFSKCPQSLRVMFIPHLVFRLLILGQIPQQPLLSAEHPVGSHPSLNIFIGPFSDGHGFEYTAAPCVFQDNLINYCTL